MPDEEQQKKAQEKKAQEKSEAKKMPEGKKEDQAAEELRFVPDKENPELATWKGDDGTKSQGFAKFPPKPGLPTDADDAGRGGEQVEGNIVRKDR